MARYELGTHRVLRIEIGLSALMFAAGVGLLVDVGATWLHEPQWSSGRTPVTLAIGVLLATVGGWTLPGRLSLRRRVAACSRGAHLVSLEVVSRGPDSMRVFQNSMCLCADADDAEPFDWLSFAWHGDTYRFRGIHGRIAGLRSVESPHCDVPLLSTGYPFSMSRATRQKILGKHDWRTLWPEDVVTRAPLPVTFPPNSRLGHRNRKALLALSVFLAALLVGNVSLNGGWQLVCGLVAMNFSVLWLALASRARATFGVLTLTDAGVELRSSFGGTVVSWDDVDRVVVSGHDLDAQRSRMISGVIGAIASLAGGVGGILAARLVTAGVGTEPWTTGWSARTDGDADPRDEVERRLVDEGMGDGGIVPVVWIRRVDRRVLLKLPGCHGWSAAHAVAAEAVARGAELDTE